MPRKPVRTPPIDRLYMIETQMEALRRDRAEVIQQLDEEYAGPMLERLRAAHEERRRNADDAHGAVALQPVRRAKLIVFPARESSTEAPHAS